MPWPASRKQNLRQIQVMPDDHLRLPIKAYRVAKLLRKGLSIEPKKNSSNKVARRLQSSDPVAKSPSTSLRDCSYGWPDNHYKANCTRITGCRCCCVLRVALFALSVHSVRILKLDGLSEVFFWQNATDLNAAIAMDMPNQRPCL